jgi:regulator of sirC expression with transglutaminase-like and TPR domain
MSLQFKAPSLLEHFESLVGHDAGFPLLETAASLALDACPTLDLQDVLHQVDQLVARLRQSLPAGSSPMQRTYLLNEFFYEKLGFAANHNDFLSPDNSYMHCVLQTRRGIPISLAVLWMELAGALDLKVEGISFPGHYMVKVYVDEGIIIQDPLTGRGMTQAMLQERLEPYRSNWGVSPEEMAPLHLFLQPATPRETIERMLRNLRNVYDTVDQQPLLLGVLDRLIVLQPHDWASWRDRGLLLAHMGLREAALHDLQTYVQHAPTPQDLPLIEARIELLRAEG